MASRWSILYIVFSFFCACKQDVVELPIPEPQIPVWEDTVLISDTAVDTKQRIGKPKITHIAKVRTSLGIFSLGLYGYDAPRTVYNFYRLANQGFYDGQRIHRVAKNFIIQFGDPYTRKKSQQQLWGSGGASFWGVPFEDEINPSTPSYRRGYQRGTVAMANFRIPNSNTSQVFICLQDLPDLPKKYTIFGEVIEGMNVVDSIASVPIVPVIDSTDGRPKQDIRILSIRVRKAPGERAFRFPKWVQQTPFEFKR